MIELNIFTINIEHIDNRSKAYKEFEGKLKGTKLHNYDSSIKLAKM